MDVERENFEAWAKSEGWECKLHPDGSGRYLDSELEAMHEGWQARASLPSAQPSDVVGAVIDERIKTYRAKLAKKCEYGWHKTVDDKCSICGANGDEMLERTPAPSVVEVVTMAITDEIIRQDGFVSSFEDIAKAAIKAIKYAPNSALANREEAVEIMAKAAIERPVTVPRLVRKDGRLQKEPLTWDKCPQITRTRVLNDMKAAYQALTTQQAPTHSADVQRLVEAATDYAEAEHTRVYHGNDKPAYAALVYTSQWAALKRALAPFNANKE